VKLIYRIGDSSVNVLNPLRRFEGDGGLGGERFRDLFIRVSERAAFLIEHLEGPDGLAFQIPERRCQQGPGAVAGSRVDPGVEERVLRGVFHIEGLAG